jgi:signal transduction histidine kinase
MAEGWQSAPEPDEDASAVRPVVLSLLLAAGYAVLCGAYIVVSGRAAAHAAANVPQLADIELVKGLGFVAATGFLFFGFAWLLLHRLAQRERALARQRSALLASDRRALAGVFASAVAHDINNVLTVANAYLAQLAPEAPPERRARSLEVVRRAFADLAALAKRLVSLERGQQPERRERLDLAMLARESVTFARRHSRLRGCRIELVAAEPVRVWANATAVRRVVLNLLLNAGDATGGKGRIEVRVLAEGGGARLEVDDDGPGVPPELRERIFEGFLTTKPEGSGLGLLSVRVTAEEHGGRVALAESALGGACFQIWLPGEDPRS